MSSIIKVKRNYSLGYLLAQIKKSSSEVISLHLIENSKFLKDPANLKVLQDYAASLGKKINVVDNKNYPKIGFALGEDIAQKPLTQKTKIKSSGISLKSFFSNIFQKKQRTSNQSSKKGFFSKGIIYLFVFLLFLLGFFGAFLWFAYIYLPTAKVVLSQRSEIFSTVEEVFVTLPNNELNADSTKEVNTSLVLNTAELVEKEVSGEMTGPATGEKEVGDKAQGKVKIFNKSSKEETVKSGEKIEVTLDKGDSEKKYVFIIQEDIKVPAKTTEEITTDSGDTKKADVFGESSANILASEIGDDYNIGKGAVSSIAFLEDKRNDKFILELDGDISGGSSKKVTVVTEKDLDDLKEKLLKKLKKQSLEELKADLGDSKEVLGDGVVYKIVSENFNKSIDEEGGEVTLSMTIKAQSLVFSSEDLKSLLSDKIEALLPQDFSLAESNDTITIINTVKDLNTDSNGNPVSMLINSKIQSFIKPKVNISEAKRNLSGKTIKEAEEYLSSLKNSVNAVIEISPRVPFLPERLPTNPEKIDFRIQIVD